MQVFLIDNIVTVTKRQRGNKMIDIDQAFKAEIEELKLAICDDPANGEEYGAQSFGVFRLWYRLAGYVDEENQTIAAMREYAFGAMRFGSAMKKKAGF